MENEIIGNEYSPAKELEFILRMLGIFYEMANFGPREELISEFELVKAHTPENLKDPDFNCVDYFTSMFHDFEKKFEDPAAEESLGHTILFGAIHTALAHCAEASRPGCDRDKQWFHISWANIYLGYLRGTVPGRQMGRRAERRVRAKNGATARHKENREMKKEAFDWFSKNRERFKSLDATADAVRSVVPVAFRTARDWAGEWNKLAKEQQK